MEECSPGGDCASGVGDPSKSDNPPVIWTPNPAGEQAQGSAQGESERLQLPCCIFSFSGSMAHIWSPLTLQAFSDTVWLSSLCLINLDMSRGDVVSQPASHSPQSKRKKDSSATPGERDESVRTPLLHDILGQCYCICRLQLVCFVMELAWHAIHCLCLSKQLLSVLLP